MYETYIGLLVTFVRPDLSAVYGVMESDFPGPR
jgi:hypothetical protein